MALRGIIATCLYCIYIGAALSGGGVHGSTASYTGLVLAAPLRFGAICLPFLRR
ncbi:hypothetical protein [Caenispirillum salinarum]|uniref:hypothetical protein n=1 Tax=Caenispirillum salinarum TaxID=859058 RepID=UPI001360B0AD|nr:hypothetical protein [Caenispirillum salinarum]